MKKLVAISLVFLLASCEMPKQATKTGQEVKKFKILAIDPPKHVYADLQEENGKVHKMVYISKHCNNWRKIKIGSEIKLTIVSYKLDNDSWQKIEAGPICPRSE